MPFKPVDRAIKIVFGPLIDESDFTSREESVAHDAGGMEIDIALELADGTVATTAVVPTTAGAYDWTHLDQGYYELELPATGGASFNNTEEGILTGIGYVAGVLPFRTIAAYDVIDAVVYDGLVLGVDPMPAATALAPAITAWVEGYLAVKLTPTVMTELYVGSLPAVLNWGPLEAVPSIIRRSGTALVADTDFRWATSGQLWPLLDLATDNWDIVYTAGYTTVPDGLQAAMDQIREDIVADDGLSAESLGDYSYRRVEGFAHKRLDLLETYRRLMA